MIKEGKKGCTEKQRTDKTKEYNFLVCSLKPNSTNSHIKYKWTNSSIKRQGMSGRI